MARPEMTPLQPQITRQAVLGLLLCVISGFCLVISQSAVNAALLFVSIALFWSQVSFSKAHLLASKAQEATQAAFKAFPDAVLVVRSSGGVSFSKDVAPPGPPVLPLMLEAGALPHPELLTIVRAVLVTSSPLQAALPMQDGRMVEYRVIPFDGQDVLVIARDITDAHRDSERIRYLATHDSLTGLLNRSSFHISLEQAITRSNRNNRPFGLLFLDLDNFKAVNDTKGHEAGDALLVEVTVRLKNVLRKSDSAYRLAGDEFTVIVENLEAEKDIVGVANKICEALAKPYFTDTQAPRVSASVGAVVYPQDGKSVDDLIRVADNAMYRAKAAGRNQCAVERQTLLNT